MKKFSLLFSVLFISLVWSNLSFGQIAAWDFYGVTTAAPPATFTATTWNANLDGTVSKTVTRGASAALGTYTGASNSFRTTGFKSDGISTANADYFQITLEAATGYTMSLSTIDAKFNGTSSFYGSTGVASQFAYCINDTTSANFTLLDTVQHIKGTAPIAMTQIVLSTVTALQAVPAGSVVYLRYYASGLTSTGGWGFASTATAGTNGLAIGGTVDATVQPVELSSFTGSANGRNIQLAWETKTELNFSKFEIERSLTDAIKWETVGTINAAGTANSPKRYTYTQKNLQAGKYLSRLKMIDNDGTYKYSNAVESDINLPSNFELSQNYPNPFNPSTKISYSLPFDARVTLDVYNIAGVKVGQVVNQEQAAGFYSVDFSTSTINKNLSSGVYLYRLNAIDKSSGKDFSSIKKMVLLK